MPKKPDIFKLLDVERKALLRVPGNALKIWLYYWMREGKERIAWGTEKEIRLATGLNKDTYRTWRKWLVDNGWLKPMGFTNRIHGEFGVPRFRVKEGTLPEIQRGRHPKLPLRDAAEETVRLATEVLGAVAADAFGEIEKYTVKDDTVKEDTKVVSELGSQGAPTPLGLSSVDQNLKTLSSEEQPQDQNLQTLLQKEQDGVQLLFDGLYPNGFESVALFLREVPHARACAEILAKEKISVKELLKYNRTHKSGGLVFRSCAVLHKALTKEEQRTLNDFVGHDPKACRICKALAKKVDGHVLPAYRQNSGQRNIFGKGDI
jgi:hypothetical protein